MWKAEKKKWNKNNIEYYHGVNNLVGWFLYTIPKEINFPRYNMKCSGANVILRGIFLVVSCFPKHLMLYNWNLDCFSNSVRTKMISNLFVFEFAQDRLRGVVVHVLQVKLHFSSPNFKTKQLEKVWAFFRDCHPPPPPSTATAIRGYEAGKNYFPRGNNYYQFFILFYYICISPGPPYPLFCTVVRQATPKIFFWFVFGGQGRPQPFSLHLRPLFVLYIYLHIWRPRMYSLHVSSL